MYVYATRGTGEAVDWSLPRPSGARKAVSASGSVPVRTRSYGIRRVREISCHIRAPVKLQYTESSAGPCRTVQVGVAGCYYYDIPSYPMTLPASRPLPAACSPPVVRLPPTARSTVAHSSRSRAYPPPFCSARAGTPAPPWTPDGRVIGGALRPCTRRCAETRRVATGAGLVCVGTRVESLPE
ncbi:hypothetical protein BV20DRAFT_56332 [Pilatotrama ljubarskyi]|nr:hypothetical protein BV20DRAFT_56332 [Pilatotrama ljubarskyi]